MFEQSFKTNQVILDGSFVGRCFVFANVSPNNHTVLLLQLFHSFKNSLIVKTHTVDNGFIFTQAKQSFFRVARLWLGSYRTNFDKTETKVRELIVKLRIFIKSSGKSYGVLKFYTENLAFQFWVFHVKNLPEKTAKTQF